MATPVSKKEIDGKTKIVWLEIRANKYSHEMELQINVPYEDKDSGQLRYSRNNAYIALIDVPEVVAEIVNAYEESTGEKLEL